MIDDKVLMVKLRSGSFIKDGLGNGREQFNINEKAILDGKYYGVILNSGRWDDVSLEKIDNNADKETEKIENILLIYFEKIEDMTYIVAIAKNTTVYRKMQMCENIIESRLHDNKYTGKSVLEKVGYHTVTQVEDMHLLRKNYIPINIPKECAYFFRAQRALSKEEKYKDLREQIIRKALDYLDSLEL